MIANVRRLRSLGGRPLSGLFRGRPVRLETRRSGSKGRRIRTPSRDGSGATFEEFEKSGNTAG